MTTTYNDASLISSNASAMTPPLSSLVTDFGDTLEWLTAVEKLRLLAILALWQDLDTDLTDSESVDRAFTLDDAIAHYGEPISANLGQALESLDGLSDKSCLDLMVAIAHQVKDGIYQR